MQVRQSPRHGVAQQMPLQQLPDAHSASVAQAAGGPGGPQTPPAQLKPGAQSSGDAHDVWQVDRASHAYGAHEIPDTGWQVPAPSHNHFAA